MSHSLSFEKNFFWFLGIFLFLTFSITVLLKELSKIVRTRDSRQDREITVDVHSNFRFETLFLMDCELKYKE